MPDDKAWGIIPARGGSKGIPAKNLQTIRGWALIARAVIAAKGATRVSRVFVSTDDTAIAAEAVKAGAEIIDRPAALSGDTASSEAALLHALDTLERSGPLSAFFAFVQCTSPFLTSADIDGTIAALASGDSAFSAAPSHRFLWRDAGAATGVNRDKARRPRRPAPSRSTSPPISTSPVRWRRFAMPHFRGRPSRRRSAPCCSISTAC